MTLHSLRTLPRDRPRLCSSCWHMLTNCKCSSLSMSFIVICTWRSPLIFVKSNFSRRCSGNCHLINSLTLHSLRTLPRDRPRLQSSCWRMLANYKRNSLSMSFIVICTWRLSLIFVKSNFSRCGSCNCHLINSLTLHSLRISGQTQTTQLLLAHAYQLQMQLLTYLCPLL